MKPDLVEANRHVTMMQSPDDWPAWPYLPLKRHVDGDLETAYLFDAGVQLQGQTDDSLQLWARLGNMYMAKPREDPPIEFASLTELYNAGWRVD